MIKEHKGGCFPDVVGFGLEGPAPDRDPKILPIREEGVDKTSGDALLLLVDRLDLGKNPHGDTERVPGMDERLHVLRKAGTSVADTSIKKGHADPGIRPHAEPDIHDVRPGPVADFGHLVDEGDLGRQEGVGGVLRELGRGDVHEVDWMAVSREGGV